MSQDAVEDRINVEQPYHVVYTKKYEGFGVCGSNLDISDSCRFFCERLSSSPELT